MKRISSFLLAVVMVISILGSAGIAQAQEWQAGNNITVSTSGNVLTVKGTGDMYNYTTSSLPPWGNFKGDISKVVIEDGVTSIGDYALSNLIAAETVTISNTVKRIGERAFSGSYSIKSINIPASVEEIGDDAFTTTMGDDASFLAEITVDSDNKYFVVEDGILYNSIKTILYKVPSRLGVEILDVLPTVITIKSGAVIACPKLTEVNLPESVTVVGEKAFAGCTKLKKVVVNNRECELALASIPNNSGLKLYGYSGTNVEHYAKNNGYTNIEFVPLNDEHTHIWDNAKVTKPATTSADGTKTYTCTKCGETKTEAIAKIASATLSTTATYYTGTEKAPGVTVKDSTGKELREGTDYTVTMDSGRIDVGRYAVKVTYKGEYSGSQTLYFNIMPKNNGVKTLTTRANGFTVYWDPQETQTTGYQIEYSTNSSFTNATPITMPKAVYSAKAVSGLAENTKYYVRIRTYTTTTFEGANYNIYSPWCVAKNVSTITTTPKLSTTATYYTGTLKTPTVTVTDSTGKTLKNGTDYTVTYASGRKLVGRYGVTITYKGNYEYNPAQTVYFNIIPKGVTGVKSVTASSKGFTVSWNTQTTQTTGYQIQYSTSSNFANAKTITMPKSSYYAKKVTGLTGNKKYYVRIRTYQTVKFNGANYNIYSPWCSAKTVTTKK